MPIDKTLCVTVAPIVSVKTDGPMTHLDSLSGDEALGLSLDTGETESDDMVMEGGTGVTAMITEMHARDFNGKEKGLPWNANLQREGFRHQHG